MVEIVQDLEVTAKLATHNLVQVSKICTTFIDFCGLTLVLNDYFYSSCSWGYLIFLRLNSIMFTILPRIVVWDQNLVAVSGTKISESVSEPKVFFETPLNSLLGKILKFAASIWIFYNFQTQKRIASAETICRNTIYFESFDLNCHY